MSTPTQLVIQLAYIVKFVSGILAITYMLQPTSIVARAQSRDGPSALNAQFPWPCSVSR
jgi:hypothetical protein